MDNEWFPEYMYGLRLSRTTRLTTIACNREEMYGDKQYTNGTYKWQGNPKVVRFKAHPIIWHCDFIAGFAGTADDLVTVKAFWSYPEKFKPPRVRDLSGLILTEEGEIYRFGDYRKWVQVHSPFAATGSGMDHALGAMAAGASPKEAVQISMKHDIYTGMGIKGERW